jgi:predicted Ser/Thr protein kinase
VSSLGPGHTIAGRYRLLSELGGGGMGLVFLGHDEETGRDVAVKILHRASPEAARRLRREARATEGLDPARVAQVYDVGETESGRAFLVMAYVEGRTLRLILQEGGVARSEALRILRELATTLAAAHEVGLVHRDVKPDNVIVRGDGRVVLLDFGIVKHIDLGDDAAHVTTHLTSDGAMIGTPAYLGPEQALGREITPAVDQFALAVTAFELLTGALPWSATDATRMLAQLLAETPPPASTLNRGVPKGFDAVLWRALSKSAEARFPSITSFVDALEAAERGEMMPAPAIAVSDGSPLRASTSASFEGPAPIALTPPASPRLELRRSFRARALFALVAVATGAFFFARARGMETGMGMGMGTGTGTGMATGGEALRAGKGALSSQTPLACPIFAVEGLPEVASRLGAAAASLACARAKWYLGGSGDEVLVPAALLDAPVQPRPDLWDFYESPGVRARTLEVAKGRGLSTLDGTVARGRDSWRVDLTVRATDGREVARVVGVDAPYLEVAIKNAVAQLWQKVPLVPAAIDPDVARWTAFPDIEAGLTEVDLNQVGLSIDGCAEVARRGAALGRAYYELSGFCHLADPPVDAGALALDESSAPALVTSLNGILITAPSNPYPDAELRRLALELASLRAAETSRLGRSALGRLEGIVWSLLHDAEQAHAALLSAVAADPLILNDWYQLQYFARTTGKPDTATSLAAVWFPQEPAFLRYKTASQSDALQERIRDGQLAYLLEPNPNHVRALGAALAEAGRAEEVRALTAEVPAGLSAPDPSTAAFLLASIDLHDGMFARALTRFEAAGGVGIKNVPILAEVLGPRALATRWAASFVDAADPFAQPLSQTGGAAIALCMNAGSALAGRCLDRVVKLGGRNSRGAGGDAFLLGAKRFAAGDLHGAVDAWRPVVAGPNEDLARLLPTDAFERAGEPDLAARIDARKMLYRQLAGVSEAAPREARRAFGRGDRARAKDLAKSVVQAWEVADATVPAVAEMRQLLARIGN